MYGLFHEWGFTLLQHTREETIEPAEGDLQYLDVLLGEMIRKRAVEAGDDLVESGHHAVDAWGGLFIRGRVVERSCGGLVWADGLISLGWILLRDHAVD